jgi:tRNA (guanosine-2'-O-)-methyltransferase
MRGPESPPFRLPDLPSPVPPHPADGLLTPERARKYRQVLARRTGRLVIVVEDCHDSHNATAIVRTCDAFGVQRVCVVTTTNSFKLNPRICQGSQYYVDLDVFPHIDACYARLRADGFRILVTDLAQDAVVGPEALLPLLRDQPLAIVFGNEGRGVSAAAAAGADGAYLIPMVGFPQSLNLSVSVAITVHHLRHGDLAANRPGDLSPDQQSARYDAWVRRLKGDHVVEQTLGTPSQDRHGEPTDELRAR